MKTVTFSHNGCTFTASIVSCTESIPHYHWLCFNTPEDVGVFGTDCFTFHAVGSLVTPLHAAQHNSGILQKLTEVVQTVITHR